ncbi:hypothetical protein [Microcoleus sp. B9-D4]|uniref:hypothetical protein n=1 Tax=Microcoleus sp. B9-D4 TaxID=2818711 RepID=UPI002FD0D28C
MEYQKTKNKFVDVLVSSETVKPFFTNPTPWLTRGAIEWLSKNLNQEMVGIEFGGGSSTPWFANQLKELHTFEANHEFAILLIEYMSKKPKLISKWCLHFSNCDWHKINNSYKYQPWSHWKNDSQLISEDDHRLLQVNYCLEIPKKIDFVLIDGAIREQTLDATLIYIKKNPNLIVCIDNMESQTMQNQKFKLFNLGFEEKEFEELDIKLIPTHQQRHITSIFVKSSTYT